VRSKGFIAANGSPRSVGLPTNILQALAVDCDVQVTGSNYSLLGSKALIDIGRSYGVSHFTISRL
jgi:hypothetical protein